MSSEDWAAWAAVKALAEAAVQAGSAGREELRAALRAPDLSVDLYKGVRGNFRPWNGQLRMPILLATHNAIVDIAPIDGFMHQLNSLDTLGQDEAEFACD